jgi:hypothetical protein
MSCYVGLDVSMEETAYCARDSEGRVLGHGKTCTDPDAIAAALGASDALSGLCSRRGGWRIGFIEDWWRATCPRSASTRAKRMRC